MKEGDRVTTSDSRSEDNSVLQALDFMSACQHYSDDAIKARKRRAAVAAVDVVLLSLLLAILVAARSVLPAAVNTVLLAVWVIVVAITTGRLLRAAAPKRSLK